MTAIIHDPMAWLNQAHYELDCAEDNLRIGRPPSALFFCQQATEKALKAYLVLKGETPSDTHDVSALLNRASRHDAGFRPLKDDVKKLNRYYAATRYPDAAGGGVPSVVFHDKGAAASALGTAKSVLRLVTRLITAIP